MAHPNPNAQAQNPPAPAPSFEAALQELEQLVRRMETGDAPLDELLGQYQRGSDLVAFCRQRLQAVEQQIQLLDNGNLTPWSPAP